MPADGTWGVPAEDGSWSGMLGQLQRHEVDYSHAEIAITNQRSLSMGEM